VVAVGAAIQGAQLLLGSKSDVLLLDVTPLSLGIETLGGVFTKLVEKNTTIPTQKKETFSTADDNQNAVTVQVYQGERPMAADNRALGQFNLEGIPPAPRGVPQIEVKFDIDANGILNVSAKDLGTNKEQTVRIEQSSGLSEDEIERRRHEADQHADEDKRKRQLAELRNQADTMCWQLEKLLQEHDAKLNAADKDAVKRAIEKTRTAAKGDDVEGLKAAVHELEQASHALSRTLYATAGPQAAGAGPGAAPTDGAPHGQPGQPGGGGGGDDEAIDAEFEVK
jgi:molecular chaperone DnaK